jgi:hypothetical protein
MLSTGYGTAQPYSGLRSTVRGRKELPRRFLRSAAPAHSYHCRNSAGCGTTSVSIEISPFPWSYKQGQRDTHQVQEELVFARNIRFMILEFPQ